ncbi:MAG: hypothetical protein ABFD18_16695 [Syntrophomonas sp.]
MISNLKDSKDSFIDDLTTNGKVDPGTFSFMEPGWWALHAATIAGIYMLGRTMSKPGNPWD